ncbi:MAG: T9SS type A sorting domain-containing protein [Candidatus Symbiothrix sp.]|jgi:hypothetical protein|nr:T9SS type A sorting domain-containing protein [Candidatus Symbiothrix sp.]
MGAENKIITIINEKRYTKVYQQFCYSETEWGANRYYYAAVREDTIAEKIYALFPCDSSSWLIYMYPDYCEEKLMADFSVKAGDEVTVYSFWPAYYTPQLVTVKDVDSVLIENEYRKRVNLVDWMGNNFNWPPDSWVEGLGSVVYGLFFPGPEIVVDLGDPPKFLCLHIDDMLIYQNANYNTCYIKDGGTGEIKEFHHSGFKIYPTLADDHLYIEKTDALYSYKIYNSNGILYRNGKLSGNTINVSNLHPGVYFITFCKDGNVRIATERFVKR